MYFGFGDNDAVGLLTVYKLYLKAVLMRLLRSALLPIASLLVCLFTLLYFFAYASNDRVVYVDSDKLLNGYKGMIEARKDYDKKRAVWQANIDTLTKDVQDAIRTYSKDMATGTEKEKQLSKELIQAKQKGLIDYQN